MVESLGTLKPIVYIPLAFACVACLAGVSLAAGKGGGSPLRGLMDETKQLAKLRDVWAAKPPAVQVGDVDTGDPDFGPFSEFVRLERGKGAAHMLPDNVGKPGRQSWPYLSRWDRSCRATAAS